MDSHALWTLKPGHYYRFHILSHCTGTSVVTTNTRRRMTVTGGGGGEFIQDTQHLVVTDVSVYSYSHMITIEIGSVLNELLKPVKCLVEKLTACQC